MTAWSFMDTVGFLLALIPRKVESKYYEYNLRSNQNKEWTKHLLTMPATDVALAESSDNTWPSLTCGASKQYSLNK